MKLNLIVQPATSRTGSTAWNSGATVSVARAANRNTATPTANTARSGVGLEMSPVAASAPSNGSRQHDSREAGLAGAEERACGQAAASNCAQSANHRRLLAAW